MRASKLFLKTQKQLGEGETLSYQLMIKGGLIAKLGRGLYSYTPIMWRVLKKLIAIVREELDLEGAQEVLLPQLQPSTLWEESGRLKDYIEQKIIFQLQDRHEESYCLGPTHEEVITSLVKNWLTSYKQLPINLYQIGNKFRDEIRPRFGLMRAREFIMKDGYAFCASQEQMQEQYDAMARAYRAIFDRLELRYAVVQADGGSIGQGRSEEFQVLAEAGEDSLLVCSTHAANVEALTAEPAPHTSHAPLPMSSPSSKQGPAYQVSTPGAHTIEQLCSQLHLPPWKIVKTLLYRVIEHDGGVSFVAVSIRGDRMINDVKLKNHLHALAVELATEQELYALTGIGKGFLGIHPNINTLGDLSLESMDHFAIGANQEGVHWVNATWSDPSPVPPLYDLMLAQEGDLNLTTKEPYLCHRGIEVGHVFNLGDKYSKALGALFTNEKGELIPLQMGCYGIGVSRLAAAIVEQRHDDRGIIWPSEIAPFACVLLPVNPHVKQQLEGAESLYTLLVKEGYDPLLDERDERLGSRLRDSDLIGIPYKLIIGQLWSDTQTIEVESREGIKTLIAHHEISTWAEKYLRKPLKS